MKFKKTVSLKLENELIDLGTRVKQIRTSKGLTQMSLASRIGKDHPSINKLENGKVNPSFIYLLEIAHGLDVKVTTFFPNELIGK